ncbi:MAG TPA: YciI family protein [Polyangiales bacterium]
MRFMIQLWTDEARPAAPELVQALARFSDELDHAGVLLAAEGLVDSRTGVHIAYQRGERSIREGARTAQRLGVGFWIVRAGSKREAVEWAQRCPLQEGDAIEVRQLFGAQDFDGY